MADESSGFRVAMGLLLCLLATGCIALGSNFQRYGLVIVEPKGERCGCISRGYAVWGMGWGIYFTGNMFYTYAVTLAPATLCSALMGTIVVWNGIIARILLGERLVVCDYHGGFLILIGIALAQAWGPTTSVDHDAVQLNALFEEPTGIAYLVFTIVLLLGLLTMLLWHERLVYAVREIERDEYGRRITGSPLSSPIRVNRKRFSESPSPSPVQANRKSLNQEVELTVLEDKVSGPLPSSDSEGSNTIPRRYTLASLDRVLPKRGCARYRLIFMPFAYPMVVGVIESLMTVCLVAASRLFYRSLDGDSQISFPIFWIMGCSLICLMGGQVWWLRKALLNLPVSRVLPIEYGLVSALTMLGGVFFFQEWVYVPEGGGWAISGGIVLMLVGCVLVGLRWTPFPKLACAFCRETPASVTAKGDAANMQKNPMAEAKADNPA